jgi:hypothetical protein
MVAPSATGRSLRRDPEARLAGFTELVATAIANGRSRTGLVACCARASVQHGGGTTIVARIPIDDPAECNDS